MKFFRCCFLAVCVLALVACNRNRSLFVLVPSDESGLEFNNQIVENDSINPIDLTNIYNGGGVGIGDFNNDGLQDIYFTGNRVPNKLYLNKGNLKFEDITEVAGVTGNGLWSRGVSIIDINSNGLLDIYVSLTIVSDPAKRKNLLYVNQGPDQKKIPHFKEQAGEYGLADSTHTTMAEFFDYDNDGDLDVYLTVNQIVKNNNPATFRPKITDGSFPSTGRLYRNAWDEKLKHPVFTDVSREAGVTIEGYGHSATIADFNKDGWKDIYVTNDFNSTDILYINNRNGTFTDKADVYFKHTSANGMGQDVIDINNDGLSDVVELDMRPEDNFRKKMMLGSNSYLTYQNSDHFGYQYQYVRNSIQLNRGPRISQKDSIGDPIFSDVGFFASIAETDWSWTPLVADFDNDGFRDIFVTNGYPKDLTDHDFIAFRNGATTIASKEFILSQIPQVKIHNYIFRNNGDITFSDRTRQWGFMEPSFSNGAAYADLDNDGDLDIVVNNINDPAFLYKNTLVESKAAKANYLQVHLKGDALNTNGLGAWIELFYGDQTQAYEMTPYRGYLSTVQFNPHFGLGDINKIDSLKVKWPDGKLQVIKDVAANQLLVVEKTKADQNYSWLTDSANTTALFEEVTDSMNLDVTHVQKDFIDFNLQKLLPHKFTEYGPSLAVGDLNGDGLEDMVIGGNSKQAPAIMFQQKNGEFLQDSLPVFPNNTGLQQIDMGVTLFDADGDGNLDIYIASGGYEAPENSPVYRDKFYLNNGKGKFVLDSMAIPEITISKSCVRVADIDRDGDLDIFVAGRVVPWKYPLPVSSLLLRNDSRQGEPKFTEVTAQLAPVLQNLGMVSDAMWADFDNDGWTDLVLTGEGMPVTFLKNEGGKLKDITSSSGIADHKGWWTSITPGDFDNDGDLDFIAGNLGLNSFYKADKQFPVTVYAKDFDNNGSFDAIPTLFLPASQEDTTRKEFPAHTRDDMIKQMISVRAKFHDYKSYAVTPFREMFKPEELKDAAKMEATDFHNSYIRNDGQGKFTITPLPAVTQYSCINGMISEDFDGDGQLDLLFSGNDFSSEVSVGRYDACNGVFMRGNGQGGFSPLTILQSGWFVPGDGKALVKINVGGKVLLATSQNKGKLKAFELNRNVQPLVLEPMDAKATVHLKNGKTRIVNLDYGSSLLSQSGRFLNIDNNISKVIITDFQGKSRTVNF